MSTIKKLLDDKNAEVWTVSPEDTVFEAITQMNEKPEGKRSCENKKNHKDNPFIFRRNSRIHT